jgi:hypothetical protein
VSRRRGLPQGLAREGLKCGVCGHEQYADRIELAEAPMADHMAKVHPQEDWFDSRGGYHPRGK